MYRPAADSPTPILRTPACRGRTAWVSTPRVTRRRCWARGSRRFQLLGSSADGWVRIVAVDIVDLEPDHPLHARTKTCASVLSPSSKSDGGDPQGRSSAAIVSSAAWRGRLRSGPSRRPPPGRAAPRSCRSHPDRWPQDGYAPVIPTVHMRPSGLAPPVRAEAHGRPVNHSRAAARPASASPVTSSNSSDVRSRRKPLLVARARADGV